MIKIRKKVIKLHNVKMAKFFSKQILKQKNQKEIFILNCDNIIVAIE